MPADMPSDFWSGWTIVITVLSLAGVSWLAWSVYFGKDSKVGHLSPVWDGNLQEGANPAPLWWFWLLLAMLIFTVGYLMLYPGLGSFAGTMKWSQGGRLDKSFERYNVQFSGPREMLLAASYADLRGNPDAMRAAESLFSRNCSGCHGPEGRGQASLFPNLRDDHWQWGGSEDEVATTIRQGRIAAMPPWGEALGKEGVGDVADYVQSMAKIVGNTHPGKLKYQQFCVACHGMNGEGNALLGAPNLADDDWLYGNSISAISTSVVEGRSGVMPAFSEHLDELQIKLLTAWLTRDPQ